MDMFKLRELVRIGDAIELISELTSTTIPEVVDALHLGEGNILSSRQADQIEEYHADEYNV